MEILREYGSLSTYQILEIMDCLNLYGTITGPLSLRTDVTSAMHKLFSRENAITYDPKSGKWELPQRKSAHGITSSLPDFSRIETGKIKFRELGTGAEYVYALYLPHSRFNAALNDWKLYPVKIGRTKNLLDRINALSFTGPGMLVPAVVLKTDDSVADERTIHDALRSSRSNIELGVRREWFRSNVLLVQKLMRELVQGRSI